MKLLSDSQARIVSLLKTNSSLSIDHLTKRLGATKTAVRRQLLSLERRGLLEREYRPGTRGRPSLYFRLAPASRSLFPSKEAEILSELLQYLQSQGQGPLVERFFEHYWEKRIDAVLSRLKKKGRLDLDARLAILKETLENEGFMPRFSFKRKGQELTLHECHCPLEAVARVTDIPCRLEKRLIEKVLNTPIDQMSIRSPSQSHCEFKLPVSKIKR